MRVELNQVGKGPRYEALPIFSASFETGSVSFAEVETERRPTVLGLIASGRMTPDTGDVTIDGDVDSRRMRAAIALVDAPVVSEPAVAVSLSGVVAEELMFAGRGSSPAAVNRYLDELGLRDHSRTPFGDVAPAVRLRILVELALLRDGVEGIVLTSPDRHGGDPTVWWDLAHEIAERGIAVLVIAGAASAAAIRALVETRTEPESEPDAEPIGGYAR